MRRNFMHKYGISMLEFYSSLTDAHVFRMSAMPSYLPRASSNCEPADPDNTLTDRLNTLLNSSGAGYVLSLCPSTQYLIQAPINFAAANQEISTLGYPTDDTRAVLVVNGPVSNGTGHTTAINGQCANCDGVKLRNVQVRQYF